jgi:hypothetical protein
MVNKSTVGVAPPSCVFLKKKSVRMTNMYMNTRLILLSTVHLPRGFLCTTTSRIERNTIGIGANKSCYVRFCARGVVHAAHAVRRS